MGEFKDFFKNKKNLANVLILGILILAIPLGINLVKTQQIIKSRATGDPIVFTGANVKQKSDGTWTALKPQISLLLSSQLGPPALTAPGTTIATCNSDGKTATVSWGSVSGAVSYLLRFNKDPQEDWTGPGDFSATLPSSSTSYQTGTIPSIGLCSWGTSHDDQHCTSCTGQESSCVTTGVNPNFVPGVHYTVSVEPHDVNGVAGSRSAADFTCGTGTGQSDNSISASSDTCQVAAADGTCASPINIGWKTTNTPGANVCVSSINGNTQFSAPSEWHMATCSDFPTCAGTPNRTNTWISPGDMFTLYAGASGCSGASCYCTGTNLGSVTITAAQSSALLSADMQNGTISIPNLLTNGTLGNMKSSTVAAGSQNVQWFGSATKPATVAYYKLTGTSSGGFIQADIYIPNDQYQSTSQKDTSFFISGNQYFAAILRADTNNQTTFSNVALYQSADHVQWFGSATLAAPGNYTLSGTVTGDGVIQADVYKAGVYEKTNTSPSTFTINSDEYFAVIDRAFSGKVYFTGVNLIKN